MSSLLLRSGDHVYHPRFGFGVIANLAQRDSIGAVQELAVQAEEYYEIQLLDGGNLAVPVSRAQNLGLRPLTNSMAAVERLLRSPAEDLPERNRDRVAILRERALSAEPGALACAVRDLLAQARRRALSAGERAWLDSACERLIKEIAYVDKVNVPQARAAVHSVISELST